MDNKAQGALEYLLLIGGALIVAAVVIALALGVMDSGKNIGHEAAHGAIGPLNTALHGL